MFPGGNLMKFFQKPGLEESERVPPGQHLAQGFPVLISCPVKDLSLGLTRRRGDTDINL